MNRDEVRIQFNRLKRITWTIEQYVSTIKDWKNFDNPIQSYLFYAVLVAIILITDLNYLLHYFITFIIGVMLYNHPLFWSYKKEVIEYLGIKSKYSALKAKLRQNKHTLLGEYGQNETIK